jgi:hypothetical protein
MFGPGQFSNPYEQSFGGYPVHPLQQQIGQLPYTQQGAWTGSPFGALNPYGQGPISPLMPQQASALGQPQFGFGQNVGPMAQFGPFGGEPQGWGQQRDPRAELLANTISQITAMRDPRVEYLAQIVTHPVVASNPVLKDLVAKELLTTALEQVTFKSTIRPELQGQGGDPYTAAAIKSQVLAELAKSQISHLPRGGQGTAGGYAQVNPQFSSGGAFI